MVEPKRMDGLAACASGRGRARLTCAEAAQGFEDVMSGGAAAFLRWIPDPRAVRGPFRCAPLVRERLERVAQLGVSPPRAFPDGKERSVSAVDRRSGTPRTNVRRSRSFRSEKSMSRFRGGFVSWIPDLRSASLHLSGKGGRVSRWPLRDPSPLPDGEEQSAAE
jgi:hypothetical protein